jgi:nuclear pore complex protein Nup62
MYVFVCMYVCIFFNMVYLQHAPLQMYVCMYVCICVYVCLYVLVFMLYVFRVCQILYIFLHAHVSLCSIFLHTCVQNYDTNNTASSLMKQTRRNCGKAMRKEMTPHRSDRTGRRVTSSENLKLASALKYFINVFLRNTFRCPSLVPVPTECGER